MDKETIKRLKSFKSHNKCKKCGKGRSYTNPLDKCFECKERFCFEHLYGGAVKDGMKQNEPIRTVCESCFATHKYHSI